MYTEGIVSIAKRENNTKREYLVVNRLQGKHIPIDPAEALKMFRALGEQVGEAYQGQPLLLVGFAETATAIGAAIAAQLDAYYIQTTRECIPGVEYLYFSESHSHATEQKLVKEDIDGIIGKVGRIVFIEDEVTTGNTILNIIGLLKEAYGGQIHFSVASILNGMDSKSQEIYKGQGIDILYLVKTDHRGYTEIARRFAGDGIYHKKCLSPDMAEIGECRVFGAQNARRLVKGAGYQEACQQLWEKVRTIVGISGGGDSEARQRLGGKAQGERILVLGTEEFMYPPLFVAEKLQSLGCQVKCHATTRSPIAVSMEADYPLHERYALASLYDGNRTAYIYDLAKYDKVLIITDASSEEKAGLVSLQNALRSCGNQILYCVRWC